MTVGVSLRDVHTLCSTYIPNMYNNARQHLVRNIWAGPTYREQTNKQPYKNEVNKTNQTPSTVLKLFSWQCGCVEAGLGTAGPVRHYRGSLG